MIESLSIDVHAFVSRVSMSFSVDGTLLRVVAIEKGTFWSPSTKVANFLLFFLLILYENIPNLASTPSISTASWQLKPSANECPVYVT